jgi:carotenoid cleavage dioxygenase
MSVAELPVHEIPALSGPNAPMRREIVAADLPVIGEMPKDLNGVYVRNGPNPWFEPDWRYHAYDGDAMLHAAYFERGRVTYRNKFVRTAGLTEEIAAGKPLWKGLKEPPRADRPDEPIKNATNTDVKFHAGKLLTMWYLTGRPYHVDLMTLETIGPADFGPEVPKLSAHSRPDEHTGELLFYDYGHEPPYMHFGVIGADGKLKRKIPVALPGPRLPHDMAVTENYAILHDFPLFQNEAARRAGRYKVSFHADLPSRFAVVPRNGNANEIRWFEAAPTYMLHVVNAWEEGDEVVMVGTPYRVHKTPDGKPDTKRLLETIHYRRRDYLLKKWRFNLKTGKTREEVIDDVLNTEFPVINGEYQGRRNKYAYLIMMPQGGFEEPRFPGLVKYNLDTGGYQAWSEGPGFFYNEPGYARRDNATDEDDGYLVSFVWNDRETRSEIHVFDCQRFGLGPVARVILPQRVPHGFHATYVSEKRILSGK